MEELQSKVTKHDDCHSSKVASNKGGWHNTIWLRDLGMAIM
jgi:hypothetical protein